MSKHHNPKQLALASQRFPALLVHANLWPWVCKIQATLWGRCGRPGSPQPMGHGMVSSHWACLRLPPYCGGWYGFPLLLKLLITALGSSTRAFHSCSPCGLLQHGFLVEQMGYYVESYCIFVSLIFFLFISLFVFFFFKWVYSISRKLGIGIGFAFDILNFIFVHSCSILHWLACAFWNFSGRIFIIWIEISSKYCKGKKAYERRSLKEKVNVFLNKLCTHWITVSFLSQ